MVNTRKEISSLGLKYSFAIVLFADGVFHHVSRNKIKYSTSTDHVSVKWKNTFYSAKLIGYANEKACQLIIKNLTDSVPLVCLERCEIDNRNCAEQNTVEGATNSGVKDQILNGVEYSNLEESPVLEDDISQDLTASNNFTHSERSSALKSTTFHYIEFENSALASCQRSLFENEPVSNKSKNGQEESIYTDDIYTAKFIDVENDQLCSRRVVNVTSNILLKDLHTTKDHILNGVEYSSLEESPVLEDISQDLTASNNFTHSEWSSTLKSTTFHSIEFENSALASCQRSLFENEPVSNKSKNGQEESIYTDDIYTAKFIDVENDQLCSRRVVNVTSNILLNDLHTTSISQYVEASPTKSGSENIMMWMEDVELASSGIHRKDISFNGSEASEDSPAPNDYSSDESLFRVMNEEVPLYLDDSELLDASPSKCLRSDTNCVSEEPGCSQPSQNYENLNLLDSNFSSDDYSNGSVFVPSPHWDDSDSDILPATPKMISSVNISENTKNYIVESTATQVESADISKKKNYLKKRNYCTFCNQSNSNIHRHLQVVHRDEEEVKKISNLPKNSEERKRLIGLLRLRGNFRHNSEVLHTQDEFVVARRINSREITKSEYVVCPKCKIFITKPALRRHYRKCNKQKGNRGVLAESRALFSNADIAANEVLCTEILPVMKRDDVFEIIRNDKLLIIYGNVMAMKYKSKHHYDMIRARLRSMGRFLKAIKVINPNITDFASIYKPCMFDTIVQVLNNFGEIDNLIGYYKKPTLPSNIGTALKYIGRLYIMECIKSKNESDKTDIEALLFLLNNGLEGPVNKTSTESILHKNRQKKQVLPPTEDIKLLCEYLEKQQKKYYTNLLKEKAVDDWLNLLKLTLISILVFNRRRPGELERALLTDYENLYYINEERNRDTFDNLSPEGKQAAESYSRFTIRGKLARGVPVLLSKENHKYLECLMKLRVTFKVLPQNPYIFGLPQKNTKKNIFKYLRAVPLMRKYSVACGARNANLLRATLLRKHVATKCAQMNLDTENVENLQNFLGHADKIHRDYYRQPIVNRDIINMSKVLEIAQGRSEQLNTNNNTTNLKKRSHSSDEWDTGSSIEKPKRQRLIEMDLGYIPRRSWTPNEKQTATSIFEKYIDENILPPMEECILAQQNINLNKRSPQQIRLWVQNEITRKKRQTSANHWTPAEKDLLQNIFHQYLQPSSTRYPSMEEIRTAISTHPEIQNRTPKRIKSQLQHLRKLRQKLQF